MVELEALEEQKTTLDLNNLLLTNNNQILQVLNKSMGVLAAGFEAQMGLFNRTILHLGRVIQGLPANFNRVLMTSRREFGQAVAQAMGKTFTPGRDVGSALRTLISEFIGGGGAAAGPPGGGAMGGLSGLLMRSFQPFFQNIRAMMNIPRAAGMGVSPRNFAMGAGYGALVGLGNLFLPSINFLKAVRSITAKQWANMKETFTSVGKSMLMQTFVMQPIMAFWQGLLEPFQILSTLFAAVGSQLSVMFVPLIVEIVKIFKDVIMPLIPELVKSLEPLMRVFAVLIEIGGKLLAAFLPLIIPFANFVAIMLSAMLPLLELISALLEMEAVMWLLEAVTKAIGFAINIVAVGIAMFINWIIELMNKIPGVDIDTVTIPALANGGRVTAPTLALIGEAGPETVTPDDVSIIRHEEMMDKMDELIIVSRRQGKVLRR